MANLLRYIACILYFIRITVKSQSSFNLVEGNEELYDEQIPMRWYERFNIDFLVEYPLADQYTITPNIDFARQQRYASLFSRFNPYGVPPFLPQPIYRSNPQPQYKAKITRQQTATELPLIGEIANFGNRDLIPESAVTEKEILNEGFEDYDDANVTNNPYIEVVVPVNAVNVANKTLRGNKFYAILKSTTITGKLRKASINGNFNGKLNAMFEGFVKATIKGSLNGNLSGLIDSSINGHMYAKLVATKVIGTINGKTYNKVLDETIDGKVDGKLTGTLVNANLKGNHNGVLEGMVNGSVNAAVDGSINGTTNGKLDAVITGYMNGLVGARIIGFVNGSVIRRHYVKTDSTTDINGNHNETKSFVEFHDPLVSNTSTE